MQLKENDKAIADYSEIIKKNPKDVEALLARSYLYEAKGDFAKGIEDCDRVLSLEPDNADAAGRKKRLQTKQSQATPAKSP
jgi:tetratricopeptide (TPR) repeat protein